MSRDGWKQAFRQLLADGRRAEALAVLDARATAHAGTANAEDKRAAFKIAFDQLGEQPDELWAWARELASGRSTTGRELACLLLPNAYDAQRKDVLALLLALSDDENWEVRLWAGGTVASLLASHFDEMYDVLRSWIDHESQFVRVAVATSVRDLGQREHPGRADALLALMEPLLADRAHEVERNLGGYAIGGALLSFFPQPTLAAVRRWAASDDEQVRWNVAMVFSAAEARKHADAALELLSELARDRRPKVWRAVAMAARNLVKGGDEGVVGELQSWLKDERKLPAALALRGTRATR